jgi:uncharacterized protein (DUF488 family)
MTVAGTNAPPTALRIYTVGHSAREGATLVDLLLERDVRQVIDVRRWPFSRRFPVFDRNSLTRLLHDRGLAYRHTPELGARREPRPASRHTALTEPGLRGYADYMETGPFREALAKLLANARRVTTAILCAEASPERCHRRLIADAIAARGGDVTHILDAGRTQGHTLHPQLKIASKGRLLYAEPSPQLRLFPPVDDSQGEVSGERSGEDSV